MKCHIRPLFPGATCHTTQLVEEETLEENERNSTSDSRSTALVRDIELTAASVVDESHSAGQVIADLDDQTDPSGRCGPIGLRPVQELIEEHRQQLRKKYPPKLIKSRAPSRVKGRIEERLEPVLFLVIPL